MWQPVMQVDRCGSQARAGVYARVPQAVRKGSCRLAWSVTGMAISVAVLVCVGAEQAASPRSQLLGAPPFDGDAREPSLSPPRLCLWIPRLWSPLVLLGACSPPCPVVLPPQSLIAQSQQSRRRHNVEVCPRGSVVESAGQGPDNYAAENTNCTQRKAWQGGPGSDLSGQASGKLDEVCGGRLCFVRARGCVRERDPDGIVGRGLVVAFFFSQRAGLCLCNN